MSDKPFNDSYTEVELNLDEWAAVIAALITTGYESIAWKVREQAKAAIELGA